MTEDRKRINNKNNKIIKRLLLQNLQTFPSLS